MVSVSVCYLLYQPMDEKIKTWTLHFPAKEDPKMEKALFDWPIMLKYDVKAKYLFISRKFSGMKFFSHGYSLNQPEATCVCICSINQSNHSISVVASVLFMRFHYITIALYSCNVITSLMSVPTINHADNALIIVTLNWLLLNNFQ